MELIPIKTRRIVPGDDVAEVLWRGLSAAQQPCASRRAACHPEEPRAEARGVSKEARGAPQHDPAPLLSDDILVLSSKAIAVAEGRIVELAKLKVSEEARRLAAACGRSPEFCQAVLEETAFRNGRVLGTCPGLPPEAPGNGAKGGAILTELRPLLSRASTPPLRGSAQHDMGKAPFTLLVPNAGMDESNVEPGFAVGWPEDPVESVRRLRRKLKTFVMLRSPEAPKEPKDVTKPAGCRAAGALRDAPRLSTSSRLGAPQDDMMPPSLAIILSDSCCLPARRGVTAFALAASGINPIRSCIGEPDLFGKPLTITMEATADQLATAANMLMGNAGQSIPAVIVRGHGLALSEWGGWVPGIGEDEDLFRSVLKPGGKA